MTVSSRKPRLVVGYDGSELAKAALRGAAELFPGSPAVVVTVWEPGLAAMVAAGGGLDAAGAVLLPPDPELVSELDHAEKHHAAVVAGEGAQLAGSLGLDAEPHAIPDRLDVADSIVEVAAEREAAAVVIGSHGASGLRSRLLGGTSHRVLASCTLPVVVVRSAQTCEIRLTSHQPRRPTPTRIARDDRRRPAARRLRFAALRSKACSTRCPRVAEVSAGSGAGAPYSASCAIGGCLSGAARGSTTDGRVALHRGRYPGHGQGGRSGSYGTLLPAVDHDSVDDEHAQGEDGE